MSTTIRRTWVSRGFDDKCKLSATQRGHHCQCGAVCQIGTVKSGGMAGSERLDGQQAAKLRHSARRNSHSAADSQAIPIPVLLIRMASATMANRPGSNEHG